MKKILSILTTISLSSIISTNIIACNTPKTNKESIKLQQPPKNSNWKLTNDYNLLKNNFDNKYYIVIWKHYNMNEWEIKKFKHDTKYDIGIETYIKKNRFKGLYRWDGVGELIISKIDTSTGEITEWKEININW